MGRTCGEPDEIELAPIGVELNGSRSVRRRCGRTRGLETSGKIIRERRLTRFRLAPRMGVHRTCGEPDEIELAAIGVELNGSGRAPGNSG